MGFYEIELLNLNALHQQLFEPLFKKNTCALAIKFKTTSIAYCLPFHIVPLFIVQDTQYDNDILFCSF